LFEFIIGDIVGIKEDYIVLENNGIGYKIFSSMNSMVKLTIDSKEVKIYTYLNVRDDGIYLYGFVTEEEIHMFKLLQLVSKIGPKIALGILSTLSPIQIKIAILNKDIDTLCQAPGIGKKTAERMLLELKDRIDKDIEFTEEEIGESFNNDYSEAINGLMSLGYSKYEVEKIVRGMDITNLKMEDIIRQALKKLSKH